MITHFFGTMGTFFKDFTNYSKDAVDNVSKNRKEVKITDTVINAGNIMFDFIKTCGEFIYNKSVEVYNSELVQNITKGAESGFNLLYY